MHGQHETNVRFVQPAKTPLTGSFCNGRVVNMKLTLPGVGHCDFHRQYPRALHDPLCGYLFPYVRVLVVG